MTDKIQKIREGIKKLKSQLLRGACSSQVAMETRCKEEAYNEVLAILDTMQEESVSKQKLSNVQRTGKNWKEPVSEDLEEVANKYGKDTFVNECMENGVCDNYDLADAFKAGAKWQKAKDQSTIELAEDHAMLAGMEKMKEEMMKEPNLSGYMARDEDGNLHVFEVEPKRLEEEHRWWDRDYNCHIIDNDAFPDLRWKDEPICVKLIIIKED